MNNMVLVVKYVLSNELQTEDQKECEAKDQFLNTPTGLPLEGKEGGDECQPYICNKRMKNHEEDYREGVRREVFAVYVQSKGR